MGLATLASTPPSPAGLRTWTSRPRCRSACTKLLLRCSRSTRLRRERRSLRGAMPLCALCIEPRPCSTGGWKARTVSLSSRLRRQEPRPFSTAAQCATEGWAAARRPGPTSWDLNVLKRYCRLRRQLAASAARATTHAVAPMHRARCSTPARAHTHARAARVAACFHKRPARERQHTHTYLASRRLH